MVSHSDPSEEEWALDFQPCSSLVAECIVPGCHDVVWVGHWAAFEAVKSVIFPRDNQCFFVLHEWMCRHEIERMHYLLPFAYWTLHG